MSNGGDSIPPTDKSVGFLPKFIMNQAESELASLRTGLMQNQYNWRNKHDNKTKRKNSSNKEIN